MYRVISHNGDRILFERLSTPRPAPKVTLKSNWQSKLVAALDMRKRDLHKKTCRGNATDDQTSIRRLVRGFEPAVEKNHNSKLIFEWKECLKMLCYKIKKGWMKSTKSWKSWNWITHSKGTFQSRFLRDGQHGVDRRGTKLGDYSMFFLPETRMTRREHVSMWCLLPTQSKYIGPNQRSICSVKDAFLPYQRCHLKRNEKWSQSLAKRSPHSHGCKKKSAETRQIHLDNGPMAEWRSIPRVSIGTRMDWLGQVFRLHLRDWHQS